MARILICVPLMFALAACGATSHTRMADPETLLAERDEWRGERTGPVALRLHIEALVDTRPDPGKAESALIVHLAVATFGDAAPIPVSFPVPAHARFASGEARFVGATVTPATLGAVGIAEGGFDPDQGTATFTLPAPPVDGVVEAIVRFDVPGTLASDARYLGLDMPVGELLLRYDLPSDAVGSFQTTLPNARPVVTDKDGRRLIALFVQKLAPVATRDAPFARFVTVKASPKGFDQTFTTSWSSATEAYRRELVERGKTLSGNYEVPYRPVGSGRAQALDAYAWVRGRPMRAEPGVSWRGARALPDVLAKNDLTAIERTQLMHWVLRESNIVHTFVIVRAGHRAPLDASFPAPGVFDTALIHLPELGLVLDPACDDCEPGQVRPALRGGQGLLLPLGSPSVTFLPL